MAIQVGDKVPSATLKYLSPEGPKEITTDELFRGKKVALFAVPGAFTPTCSQRHLPGYVDKASDLKSKGIDTIACVAVNDAFVMGAWGKAQNCGDNIMMLADGSGDFTARGRARTGRAPERARHALAALFDAGRGRRRQEAQCRGPRQVRGVRRRLDAEGAVTAASPLSRIAGEDGGPTGLICGSRVRAR